MEIETNETVPLDSMIPEPRGEEDVTTCPSTNLSIDSIVGMLQESRKSLIQLRNNPTYREFRTTKVKRMGKGFAPGQEAAAPSIEFDDVKQGVLHKRVKYA